MKLSNWRDMVLSDCLISFLNEVSASASLSEPWVARVSASTEPTDYSARPADLAEEYLDMCERHSVPSPLFIRRHLRWIFRAELEPDGPADLAARDSWRARLWTFLVRPYLETLWQFREVVRLFRHLEAGGAAADGAPNVTVRVFIASATPPAPPADADKNATK